MCFCEMPLIGFSRGADLHAANLTLAGNDDDLEISRAAFAAKSDPQYSHLAEQLLDLGLNVAEGFILCCGPVGCARILSGGLVGTGRGDGQAGRQT